MGMRTKQTRAEFITSLVDHEFCITDGTPSKTTWVDYGMKAVTIVLDNVSNYYPWEDGHIEFYYEIWDLHYEPKKEIRTLPKKSKYKKSDPRCVGSLTWNFFHFAKGQSNK